MEYDLSNKILINILKFYNVGERGLEPPTSRSQTARSSQLSYSPLFAYYTLDAHKTEGVSFEGLLVALH